MMETNASTTNRRKVIVIGAGPAGLVAGYELVKIDMGFEVTIVEASEEIGGLSKTVHYHGNCMDIGGHRFFSKDKRINEWWLKMLPMQGQPAYDDSILHRPVKLMANGPDPEAVNRVLLSRKRLSRIYYSKKFFDYPVKANFSTLHKLGFIKCAKIGKDYIKACVHKKEERSLEDFYRNRFGNELYQTFFKSYTTKVWGRSPAAIAPDWGRQRIKGLSIGKAIRGDKKETSLIEKFSYPKYGPGQMWETTAAKFVEMGGTLLTSTKVLEVLTRDNQVIGVRCETDDGEVVYKADIVMSSMPLKDLVMGIKATPTDIKKIAENLVSL